MIIHDTKRRSNIDAFHVLFYYIESNASRENGKKEKNLLHGTNTSIAVITLFGFTVGIIHIYSLKMLYSLALMSEVVPKVHLFKL